MSHRASHWLADIPPGLLKDSDFRVLFHLCDAHNSKRAPHEACFPGQDLLREATGLSNGGLNNSLNRIEAAGLMKRRRTRMADGTKGPTYYILGCDDPQAQPSPFCGDGPKREQNQPDVSNQPVDKPVDNPVQKPATISKLEPPPSPHSGVHHLHVRGDKPVKEPVKEPCAPKSGNPKLDGIAILIRSGKTFLCQSISAHAARSCISAGLVSPDECKQVGIAI